MSAYLLSSQVLGIVRSATRLEALTYVARGPVDPRAPWRIEHVCELRPLPPELHPALWRAWHALAAVETWNDATLAAVQLVLRETVPAVDDGGALPALGEDVHPPEPPRATAAHPRAYRGTHVRPPRPPQPAAVDVRRYLLARRHIDQVLAQLDAPPHNAVTEGLDPLFVLQLSPVLAGCAEGELGAFAALAQAFELARAPRLRAALVAVYRAAADPARGLAWWSHVLAHEPAHRVQAAQLVSASGVAATGPITPELATTLAALAAPAQWSIYRALARGAAPAYLLAGLALGAISSEKIDELAVGQLDATEVIVATVDRLDAAMEEDSGGEFWLTHLWSVCGHQPELVALLASPDFVALEPSAAFRLLRLACSPRWTPDTAVDEWAELAPIVPRLAEFIVKIPRGHQRKFIDSLAGVYAAAVYRGLSIRLSMAMVHGMCARVARSPFGTEHVLDPVMVHLSRIREYATIALLEGAPDASWLALEAACARLNDARLIGRGLYRIGATAPDLFRTFATSPGVAAISSVFC